MVLLQQFEVVWIVVGEGVEVQLWWVDQWLLDLFVVIGVYCQVVGVVDFWVLVLGYLVVVFVYLVYVGEWCYVQLFNWFVWIQGCVYIYDYVFGYLFDDKVVGVGDIG